MYDSYLLVGLIYRATFMVFLHWRIAFLCSTQCVPQLRRRDSWNKSAFLQESYEASYKYWCTEHYSTALNSNCCAEDVSEAMERFDLKTRVRHIVQ